MICNRQMFDMLTDSELSRVLWTNNMMMMNISGASISARVRNNMITITVVM